MTTAVEKSKELVDKFRLNVVDYEGSGLNFFKAKQCALIAVDEIIANIEPSVSMDIISARIKYWQEVKQEIEKL
jgi:hypothetical protein